MRIGSFVFLYCILPVILIFVCVNLFASLLLVDEPWESHDFPNDSSWFNPYPNQVREFSKVGIHIHSDEVWFTPERDNQENIYYAHKDQGFDWLSISDYNLVTNIRNLTQQTFDSYEYGNNLFKKHFLVIGTKKVDPDPFYFYSSLKNTQWILNRFNRRKAFVVVNHPHLFNSFPTEKLEKLYGYHAIEVYSPFGDDTSQWDVLLKKGIPVLGMSSGDLHFLPKSSLAKLKISLFKKIWKRLYFVDEWDGEAFRRYVLVHFENTEKSLYRALCNGSYLLVNKFDGQFPEFLIHHIGFREDTEEFSISFQRPVKEIQFITNQKNPALRIRDSQMGVYKLQPEDTYVRIEVMDLNGFLASNPVLKKNKFRKFPICNPP